jgi:hypothetical protein
MRWIVSTLVIVVAGAAQMIASDSEVSGIFKGNDQPAKLAFVSAHKGTPLRGQETIKLVFSEKDHSKDEQADLKALFGDYGQRLGHWNSARRKSCDLRCPARGAQTEAD